MSSGSDGIPERPTDDHKADKVKGWRKQVSFEELI